MKKKRYKEKTINQELLIRKQNESDATSCEQILELENEAEVVEDRKVIKELEEEKEEGQ